jgi:hypothetical protein
MAKNEKTINQREKTMGFIYVLLLFFALSATCCLLLFLHNSDSAAFGRRDFAVDRMKRINEYREMQRKTMETIEQLHDRIAAFNPSVNAAYEEDHIRFAINELREIYEKHSLDTRYRSFMHIANFYYLWYADRKTLWSLHSNIERFTAYLEECETGLSQKKEDLAGLKK